MESQGLATLLLESQVLATLAPTFVVSYGSHEEPADDGAYTWAQHWCWVKCDLLGEPLEPLEVAGLVNWQETASDERFITPTKPNTSPQTHSTDIVGQKLFNTPHDTQSTDIVSHDAQCSGAAGFQLAMESQPSMSSEDGRNKHELMLEYLYKTVRQQETDKDWQRQLPKVVVKTEYIEKEGPVCAADNPKIKRCDFPKQFKQDFVDTPDFKHYLKNHESRSEGQINIFVLGVGRALGALNVEQEEGQEVIPKTDVSVMVQFYTSGEYTRLLDIPIMHPKYHSWTTGVLEGLVNYCQFHIRDLRRRIIFGEKGSIGSYISSLEELINELQAGHHKRCSAYKEEGYARKAAADQWAIENFPSVAKLQNAVSIGYSEPATQGRT